MYFNRILINSSRTSDFIRSEDRVRHYMVDQLPNGKFIVIGEPKVHRSLHDLILHHQRVRTSIIPLFRCRKFASQLSWLCVQEKKLVCCMEVAMVDSRQLYSKCLKIFVSVHFSPWVLWSVFTVIEMSCDLLHPLDPWVIFSGEDVHCISL